MSNILDKKVSGINAMIQENARIVLSGQAPNVQPLETEVVEFIEQVKKLSGAEAKQYLDLVSVWATEIRNISDKLNQTKARLEQEINQAGVQGKAATAYAKASKPAGE